MIFKISWRIFPGLGDSRVNAQLFLYVCRVGGALPVHGGQVLALWMGGWMQDFPLPSLCLSWTSLQNHRPVFLTPLCLRACTGCKVFILSWSL